MAKQGLGRKFPFRPRIPAFTKPNSISMKNLKFFSLLLLLLLPLQALQAQKTKLPPFKVEMADGKVFKASQLPYDKSIVIAYFSPDCDDCQDFVSSLIKNIKSFSHTSIVLVTQEPKADMAKFIQKNKLGQYKNIYVGSEEKTLFLGQYYNLEKLPFVAVYDKMGNLQATYVQHFSLADFIKKHKNIL